jgi:hypothetical protein
LVSSHFGKFFDLVKIFYVRIRVSLRIRVSK